MRTLKNQKTRRAFAHEGLEVVGMTGFENVAITQAIDIFWLWVSAFARHGIQIPIQARPRSGRSHRGKGNQDPDLSLTSAGCGKLHARLLRRGSRAGPSGVADPL